jgi:acetyl esterase/lipase
VPDPIRFRSLQLSLRSRLILWLLRKLLKPFLGRTMAGPELGVARMQLRIAGQAFPKTDGRPLSYRYLGQARPVPGHVLGDFVDLSRPCVLWLHGGGFVLPASPGEHLGLVVKLSRELGADAFVPDYRLAPLNPYPAGLNDCEAAYRALLEMGVDTRKLVIGGDSAGGNLLFGLLQRIRKHGLPMPACTIGLSPATDISRTHGPQSRALLRNIDALLPADRMQRVVAVYANGHDTVNPELSPLYGDCRGFPPLLLIASDAEILLDDSVLMARRAAAAGVTVRCDVWPRLPHAFPLFSALLPEAALSHDDMLAFAREHLS